MPLPTPTATPPRYQPFSAVEKNNIFQDSSLTFSQHPTIINDRFTLSAVFEGKDAKPTEIHLWYVPSNWTANCLNDYPVVFIGPEKTGTAAYSWTECVQRDWPMASVSKAIPWGAVSSWSYVERFRPNSRLGMTEPQRWDWHVNADVFDANIPDNAERFLVIIFSGDTILARVWLNS